MLKLQDNNDEQTPKNKDMYKIHFQRNSANDADNKLADSARKLLAIRFIFMSPVSQNLDEFMKLTNDILTGKRKIVTAQEIIAKSKSDRVLIAEKLVKLIPPGTLVGGSWNPFAKEKKTNTATSSTEAMSSSAASSSSSSSFSSSASASKSEIGATNAKAASKL